MSVCTAYTPPGKAELCAHGGQYSRFMFARLAKNTTLTAMKKLTLILLALVLLPWSAHAELTEAQAGRIARSVGSLIGQLHFRKSPLDDTLSEFHLKNYLDALDFGHMIFLAKDVEEFNTKYATRLDNEVRFGRMKPATEIYERFLTRLEERQKDVSKILAGKLDFTKQEKFNPIRAKLAWPKTEAEARELWRQRIKFELMSDQLTHSPKGTKPDAKKLKEAYAKIDRRYKRLLKNMKDNDMEAIMDLYLSAMTRAYDPHSDFMSPHEVENFKINMKDMQLSGIGAVLRVDDGYTTIVRIMQGGPAARSKLIHAGDKVVGVQNPGDKETTDLLDMTIDKVVQLIRGKKGTDVKLTIIPNGQDERKVITITRDIVKLEESLAKAYIIERKRDGKMEKLGVINLPGFYPKCAEHCRVLLESLKAEKVDGVVLDLRRNGGGILQEAIDLTGLFIETGPVVQVRERRIVEREVVHRDKNEEITYNGPLIVAVSHFSASASEIVAAALQDYGRAIIVGGKTTHGKGTVQQLLPLNRRFVQGLGEDDEVWLKTTVSKFYRINGATTQLDGVTPDIVLPSIWDYMGKSEGELPRALEADKMKTADYKKLNRVEAFFTSLQKASDKRTGTVQDYKYIRDDIKRARDRKENPSVSINEAARRKERADNKARIEARNKERAERKQPAEKYFEQTVKGATANQPLKKLDPPKPKKENADPDAIPEDDSNTFTLDPELRETLQILSDFVKLSNKFVGQLEKK